MQRRPDGGTALPGELVRGRKPGDTHVRIRRESLGLFRRTRGGHLVATEEASEPAGAAARSVAQVRNVLIGRPLDSEAAESERLSVLQALPILSSDALSSVAYGPEAALTVLAVAGSAALIWNVPIAIAVALLMLIVTISYQQVIRGHPGGGGSYAVARANLGVVLGLVAAAALLVDYVLTVSVSVSSGVDALVSPFPGLGPYRALLSIGLVAVMLLGNLRGVRESGMLFAVPTYLFVVAILVLIAAGLTRAALGGAPHPGQYPPLPATEPLTPLLVLGAFAAGCSSMTGIEAVSNGVPGFKEPRVRNAIRTLAVLGGLLVLLFVGVEALDVLYAAAPRPGGSPTVLAQIAAAVFTGPTVWLYYVVQLSTTLILVLAANTSFNGLPRLCAILARDDFLPHQFGQLGNRLVYSTAIVLLAVAATIIMLAFAGSTTALINLFALGVFTAFSLAQAAMARQWWTRRDAGWRRGFAINLLGAVVTALVDVVIIATKSPHGAWVVLALIPTLVLAMWAIHRHYTRVRAQVRRLGNEPATITMGPVVVPVLRRDGAADDALAYGRRIGDPVVLEGAGGGVGAVVEEIDAIQRESSGRVVTVVIPDEARPLWTELLFRPDLVRLKLALLPRPGIVAASSPGFLDGGETGPDHVAIVPVADVDAVTVHALAFARALATEVVAVHVVADVDEAGRQVDDVPERFHRWAARLDGPRPRLVVIESPYRAVVPPLVSYVLRWRMAHSEPVCTVVVPELVERRLWTVWLHNHRAFWLKAALLRQPGIGVADVTFHLGEGP